ncbi:hypothetical protein BVRB_2g041430 [Beta vulgaris subsp. vulgaris]|uniref:uncharacterized protein At5g39865 n=1 Tax=Beta vulgaris subsp. vulgaris TaxID=3555 RepID=UPI00053F899C|nr:uncharacterized protein At5g39865 [Beta vulgaris subsp. vulgaris]KMT17089.1 hypothetical protein BVRB_2g041430 [Beta vulgaris subsp. vulgaris]
MAGIEENRELSTSKPSNSSTTKGSFFNRSMTTIQSSGNSFSKKAYVSSAASTIADKNANSVKKWYNSVESVGNSFKGKVWKLRNLFESPKPVDHNPVESADNNLAKLRPVKSFTTDYKDSWSILDASSIRFPGTEDRVVLYFTSLRGIRRTREDCDAVRMILRAYKVFVDERDVSMDAAYKKELLGLLGEKHVSLPHVFINGRYLGGVDVVRQLNETGELRKILQALPMRERRFVCDACGDVRFLPCSNCSGSRKLFDEDEQVIKRCLECNENGLIRCPECCL